MAKVIEALKRQLGLGTVTVQLTTTAPDEVTAERLAGLLLDQRLAACVQVVGPITSHYRWEGARQRDTEWLCLAKTTASVAGRATAAVVAAHPYDEPEVLVTPVAGGSAGYRRWVAAETRN